MTLIHIVVLNWNQPDLTIECLNSVEKLKKINGVLIEVVLVDNASSDESVKKFKRYIGKTSNKHSYKLIVNDSNLGFAKGNNKGIRYALQEKSDYVIILNNDTEIDNELVIEFINSAKKYPKAGMFSPKMYFSKGYEFHKERYKQKELGNVIWAAGGDIDWSNVYGSNHGVDEVDKGQFEKSRDIDFASGACVMFRAKALEDVGLFDNNYFMYFEDTDLSVRMKKKGWKIIFVPKARLWHKVAQSSAIGGKLNDYFITRNRLLFANKYASLRTKFALFRESIRFLISGREWQRKGVLDFYLHRFGKGRWGT